MGVVYKYFCDHCQQYLFGDSLEMLASNLNSHNGDRHPMEFAGWKPETVIKSSHYMGMGGPMPEYLTPYGTTSKNEWGGAKPPQISERDKIMLAKGYVKW